MSNLTQTPATDLSVTLIGAQNIKISNFNIALPYTEYEFVLQDSLKTLIIRTRLGGEIKYSFTALESQTKYITLKPGCVLTLTGLGLSGKSLFFTCSKPDILEIQEHY